MLGNDADALDATQDALVAAIRALGRFDGRSSFGTWIYRIATNTCIDEMRRRRRRPVTGLGADVAEIADQTPFGAPGLFVVPTRHGPDPETSETSTVTTGAATSSRRGLGGGGGADPADVVTARVDIDTALAALPSEFRTAVVLRDVCDLPYDEIAEILAVPVGTVRSRIARARSALAATWHTDTAADTAGNEPGPPGVRNQEERHQGRVRRPGPVSDRPQKEDHTP